MKRLLLFLFLLVSSTFAHADTSEEKVFGGILAPEEQIYPAYYYLVEGAKVEEGDVDGIKYYNSGAIASLVKIIQSFTSKDGSLYPILMSLCTACFLVSGYFTYKKVALGQEEVGRASFNYVFKVVLVMSCITYLLPVAGRLCVGLCDSITGITYADATSKKSTGRAAKIKNRVLAPMATDTTVSYIMMSDLGQKTVEGIESTPEEVLKPLWGEKTKQQAIVVMDEWTANVAVDHRKIIECFEGKRDYGQTAKELAAYYGQGAWAFANILGKEGGDPREKHLAFLKSLRSAQYEQYMYRLDMINRNHTWSDEVEKDKKTFGYMTLSNLIKPEAVEITRPPTLAESYVSASVPENKLSYETVSKLPETVQSATKYAGIQQALAIWTIPLSLAVMIFLFSLPEEARDAVRNPIAISIGFFVTQGLTVFITYALLMSILDAGTAPLGMDGNKYGVVQTWDAFTKDGGSLKNIFLNTSGSTTEASMLATLIKAAPLIAGALIAGTAWGASSVMAAADNHAAKNAGSVGVQKAASAVSSFASKNWWVPGMAGINAARSIGTKLGSLFNSRR